MYLWLFSQRVPLLAQQDVEDDDAGCVQQRLCKARRDERQDPAQTRQYVIAALEMLSSKRESNPPKKHGNLPL